MDTLYRIYKSLLLPLLWFTIFAQVVWSSALVYWMRPPQWVLEKTGTTDDYADGAFGQFVLEWIVNFSDVWVVKLVFFFCCMALNVRFLESLDAHLDSEMQCGPMGREIAPIGYVLVWPIIVAVPGTLLFVFFAIVLKTPWSFLWTVFLGVAAVVGLIASLVALSGKK